MELSHSRNFVRGTIDGMLTSFGTVIGASVSASPHVIIIAAIASGIASSFGNLSSAFTAETAEVYKEITHIGRKMAIDSKEIKSLQFFKSKISDTYKIAFIEGGATLAGSVLPLLPFFFALPPFGISVSKALIFAVVICLSLMFVLGGLIGKLSKENIIKMALKTGAFGIITFIVVFTVTKLLGVSGVV